MYGPRSTRLRLAQQRQVQVPEQGHRDRPRDRRGGHDQIMRVGRRMPQRRALVDAELVLRVDHHQRQLGPTYRQHGTFYWPKAILTVVRDECEYGFQPKRLEGRSHLRRCRQATMEACLRPTTGCRPTWSYRTRLSPTRNPTHIGRTLRGCLPRGPRRVRGRRQLVFGRLLAGNRDQRRVHSAHCLLDPLTPALRAIDCGDADRGSQGQTCCCGHSMAKRLTAARGCGEGSDG